MSLGNSSVHQEGEIPEITKLPNGRIRVVRRFVKFTREDVDNVQLGTLLGDFGDLDTADEQIPNQGYTNCRLIEVEVEKSTTRSSGTDSSSFVLVQTYETLTDVFVETTDPTISYSESGLKQVTKVSRAISGTTSSNVVGTTFIPVDPSGDPLVPDVWLASSQIEDNTAFAELTEVYIEAGILSETIDKVGSQQSTIIESIKIEPTAPTGYVLANQQKSEFEGLQTNRFTFLKPDVELSNSEDNIGSENRITEQWFKPSLVAGTDPVTVDRRIKTGYSLARKQVSDVEGIPTEEYTFLKDNVVLSVSQDRVGSQLAVTNEVFKPSTDSITGVDISNVALVGYSEANRQKSDFEGIPTIKYSFLKNDVQLSKSEDNVGSQLAEIEEWFNPSLVAGGDPVTVNRKIKTGYSLAKEEESDVGGIPTARYTFLKDNVQLSESQDKVGSQNATVEEWFKPVTDSVTPEDNRNVKSGYSLAKEEVSDVEGIPTERYTFLKDDVLLSESEDNIGSQNKITEEWFKPVTDSGTPANNRNFKANYSLGSERASDIDGIPTVKYTFLVDDVQLSSSEDRVGSQNAIVEDWFKPVTDSATVTENRNVKSGYELAKEEVSDVDGIPTARYTFLEPSILSLQQEFDDGFKVVTVRAFSLTPAQIAAQVSTIITSNHKISSKEESDYNGIKTSVLKYQINESFSEDYELNGLKRISQTELSETSFSTRVLGGVAGVAATPPDDNPPNVVPSGSPLIGLYLSTQEIDNGGALKTRTSTWIESGTLQQEKRNISDGLIEYTTKYIAVKGSSVGPIVDESIENFEGLNVFTVVDIRDASGADPVGASPVSVNSFSSNVPFKYAGVVKAQHDKVYYGENTDDFVNVLSFNMRPPVEVTVLASVDVYLQKSGSIVSTDFTHASSVGYWNPTSWAEVYQGGFAWGGTPFSETQGLRGYRLDNDISGIDTYDGSEDDRTYVSNGVIISQRYADSLDAFNVQQFEYTNNGGYYEIVQGDLWTGQTSGAKGIAKITGPRDSGVVGFSRTGSVGGIHTNTTPFIVGENITTSSQYQGNRKTLGRSLGDATYVVGTSDFNGNKFSLNSKRIYALRPFMMKLSGGPENPSNKKWVLDVKIEPAFQDVTGVKYYRKTIVTANIP